MPLTRHGARYLLAKCVQRALASAGTPTVPSRSSAAPQDLLAWHESVAVMRSDDRHRCDPPGGVDFAASTGPTITRALSMVLAGRRFDAHATGRCPWVQTWTAFPAQCSRGVRTKLGGVTRMCHCLSMARAESVRAESRPRYGIVAPPPPSIRSPVPSARMVIQDRTPNAPLRQNRPILK